MLALIGHSGCARVAEQPELHPEKWAPETVAQPWNPPVDARITIHAENIGRNPTAEKERGPYDLPALIDLALSNNPQTREAWAAARAAAASWAIERGRYYPVAGVSSESGYERIVDQVPKHWGTLKNWQSTNLLTLNYDLLDFGRREASAQAAHEQLIAANFGFNRQIQSVIFEVEKSFYILETQRANVKAAEAIVRLATTDRIAVEKRHRAGLATKPDVLLARQREARANYELQNAELGVSDAQADLALALGIRVDALPAIATNTSQTVPATLNRAVESLIDNALQQRPDLASAVAALRAKDAEVKLARASMYPTVKLGAYYGSHAFNYRLSNPPTPQFTAMAPEYAAMVTVKWDAFAGFEHLNAIGRARSLREQQRMKVRELGLTVASQVWRAYYAFETAAKKYQYAQALLDASQSSYDSNYKSFNQGLATIVDLLSSERELADAKYTEIQSTADVLISAAAVAYATGAVSAGNTSIR
jgi:outer membrane protein